MSADLPRQNALVSTARAEALKLGEIKQVDRARLVAGMKAQLLIAGQARYTHTAKSAPDERLWRIFELSAAKVGLAAVARRIENHRMNVDPTAALSDQLNTNRSPISLHAVAQALQNPQRHRLVASVQRQVEITVQPRLPTNQSVDTPTAGDPN